MNAKKIIFAGVAQTKKNVIQEMEVKMSNFEVFKMTGVLKYPKFKKPMSFDNASNSFIEDWENGEYGTLLEVPTKLSDEHTAKLNEIKNNFLEELVESKKYGDIKKEDVIVNLPYQQGKKDDGSYSGNIEFKFKRRVKNKKGEKASISYVDSQKEKLSEEQVNQISGGSEVNIAYMVYSWDKKTKDPKTKVDYIEFGISLCLLGVQVVKMVGNNSVIDLFDSYDDGYKSNEIINSEEILF